MYEELAFNWRPVDDNTSAGLDFLGLASPIEGILDAETIGITNATERARNFSIVLWIDWKYAKQRGQPMRQPWQAARSSFRRTIREE